MYSTTLCTTYICTKCKYILKRQIVLCHYLHVNIP